MKAKSDPLPLRPVTEKDIKPLAALWLNGWRLGHADYAPEELIRLRTIDSFEDRIRERLANCLVSGPIGAPNGFLRIIDDDIDQFYVDPNAVGQGLGRRLMAAAEQYLLEQGITAAHLYCAEQNDRAAGFYEAMGWINTGVQNVAFETSAGPYEVPVIRFEKTLP